MAWTSPMTAVATSAFTAAQFNTHVRDNLNETAPAKASAAGQIFVATGVNSIAARTTTMASVNTAETTTFSSDVDLATAGPTVTVTTGTSAIVALYGRLQNDTVAGMAIMRYVVSGASSIAADDNFSLEFYAASTQQRMYASAVFLQAGLTAGSNVFTCKYRTNGTGTGTFGPRKLTVIPL